MNMIGYFKGNPYRIFALISFLLCVFYAAIFQPITWQAQGDAGAYIILAKQFLGTSTENLDLSHRQPLYSLVMVPFLFFFGESFFVYPLMWFQFFLVFLSSLVVFKIFHALKLNRNLPFIAGLLYLLNLSTIHYGFNILSETLALFIFVSIVYFVVKYSQTNSWKWLVGLGVISGLMVLARYNAMGLPLFVLVGLLLIHYHNHRFGRIRHLVLKTAIFCFAAFLIVNIWMIYNYHARGFYGIIQKDHPRFSLVVYSRINENVVVSPEHRDVFEIFLEARRKLQAEMENEKAAFKKGSLLNYKLLRDIYFFFKGGEDIVGGLHIYGTARDELMTYYGLDKNDPESVTKLGLLLQPFNQEIQRQTKKDELRQRFSALLQTLRHTGGTLPVNEPLNLNILPSWVWLLYRLGFLMMMFITLTISAVIFLSRIWIISRDDKYLLLVLILLVFYFPISHFMAITPGDANRFKFPAEPIILGLFVYYVTEAIGWLKRKVSYSRPSTA